MRGAERDLRHIKKTARRAAARILGTDYGSLGDEAQVRHNAYVSLLGAVASITKPSSVRKVESKVAESRQSLPLAKTLEAFK